MTAVLEEGRPRETLPRPEAAPAKRKRVMIVGGGFAGLAAAHALRHADTEVVLIDRRNHHIFQPLLYQVATAGFSPAQIASPIAPSCAGLPMCAPYWARQPASTASAAP